MAHLLEGLSKYVPPYMWDGIEAYVISGQPQGDFVKALMTNDFKEMMAHGDESNLRNLRNYGLFLFNYMPMGSHGSVETYDAWIANGGLAGGAFEKATEAHRAKAQARLLDPEGIDERGAYEILIATAATYGVTIEDAYYFKRAIETEASTAETNASWLGDGLHERMETLHQALEWQQNAVMRHAGEIVEAEYKGIVAVAERVWGDALDKVVRPDLSGDDMGGGMEATIGEQEGSTG